MESFSFASANITADNFVSSTKEVSTMIREAIGKRALQVAEHPQLQEKLDKEFAAFILDIGTTFPNEIKQQSLPFILQLADNEVVAIRSAVLPILTEVLQRDKVAIDKGKELTPEITHVRNELLEQLESSMCDISAVVRSKTISLISKLVETKGLFIQEIQKIADGVADRILDCAVGVRKSAFQFFCTLINSEPILGKYTPDDLHEYALAQRKRFMENRLKHLSMDNKETVINIYVREFTDHINKTYMGKALRSRPLLKEIETPDSAVEHIQKLASEMKIWEACECFYLAIEHHADNEVFRIFVNNHTFDLYRTYIGKEAGTDLNALQDDLNNGLDLGEALETDESVASRKLHHHLQVLESMSEFLVSKVIPISLVLLENGASADQTEALGFFASLATFEYPISVEVEKIIFEVSSQMSNKPKILEPFCLIFFRGSEYNTTLGLMKCLVNLMKKLGQEKRKGLKFVIEEMVSSKKIHVSELRVLWDIVALRVPEMNHEDSKIALYILYICGSIEPKTIRSLFDQLLEIPLGLRGFEDMEFAYIGLMVIDVYLKEQQKTNDFETTRWPPGDAVFTKIQELIKFCLSPETRDLPNKFWADVINLGISIIYDYCSLPEIIVNKLANQGYDWFFGDTTSVGSIPETNSNETYAMGTEYYEMTEGMMWKFLVFARAMTAYHHTYYNVSVQDELKKQLAFRRIDNIPSNPKVKNRLRRSFMELNTRRKSDPNNHVTYADTAEDSMLKADSEELDAVVGITDFDEETERLRRYIDSLSDNGFISCYWEVAQHICAKYNKIQTPEVRILTLRLYGFCMLLRPESMETGLELFMKTWNFMTEPDEKIEIIQLAILFNEAYPNIIEPCNPSFLTALRSDSHKVRLMAVNFVIFLCEADLFKLKDILADLIICLDDDNKYIKEATKLFLRSCHENDTMFHNYIPDMVIRLSGGGKGISKEKFQSAMKTFLQPFKKVTEVAGIVDKLLDRFSSIGFAENLAEDNAYCLSLLNHNERSFKIIRERLPTYAHYLRNDSIYNSFTAIAQNVAINCKDKKNVQELLDIYLSDLNEKRP